MNPNKKQIGIFGFMGAGKTTVGESLAETLNWEFFDTDQLIEKRAGMKISEIFADKGEEAFREIERSVVAEVCKQETAVISFGGGVPLDSRSRRIIRNNITSVLLRASPKTIAARTSNSNKRPLLNSERPNRQEIIEQLMDRRESFYAEIQDIEIVTDDLSVQDVVEIILERLSL